jgi:hypothetical protein
VAKQQEKGNMDHRPIRTREERGVALNAQKPNSIADIASVLGGAGRGNKIVLSEDAEGAEKKLLDVKVNWANDQDREYAQKWSGNVTHGLFEKPSYISNEPEKKEEKAPEPVAE